MVRYLVVSIGAAALVLFGSSAARALEADVNGSHLQAQRQGGIPCIDLTGRYSGFRVVSTTPGKTAKICADAQRINILRFHHVTIVATEPSNGSYVLTFEHEFPGGPKGLIYARTELHGFFAKASGAGVPTGAQIGYTGILSQAGKDTVIGEEIQHAVADSLESAVLKHTAREQFVISGNRTLKGAITFTLPSPGDKLVLEDGTSVVIDNVERRQ